MIILGIDPGVMTGYCAGVLENDKLILNPLQFTDDVDDLWSRLESLKPRYVIIEDFEFRQKTRTGLNLFPVQLIGVTRLWERKSDVMSGVHVQKAATGKSYYSDNTLKSMGLYKRGVPHGLDAMRHLLQWFTFGAGYQFNKNVTLELKK